MQTQVMLHPIMHGYLQLRRVSGKYSGQGNLGGIRQVWGAKIKSYRFENIKHRVVISNYSNTNTDSNTTNTYTITIQLRPSNNFDSGCPKSFGESIFKMVQHHTIPKLQTRNE